MKTNKKIKAIIFDVGGVLALGHYASKPQRNHRQTKVHEYMSKKLKIPVDQYFDSLDTNYALSIEGKVSRLKVVKSISKNLSISPSKLVKLFYKAYKKNFKQNKQLFKQAFKLKKQGYKIGILSDQWHLSYEALMPEKLYNNFDKIVVSCNDNIKMRKPNPKIYKLILKKLKVKPGESLFIDNQNWNIIPAKKLKMKTILFKSNKQLFNEKKWKELF